MAISASTLEKLNRLATLYRHGYQSDTIDRALDKIITLEQSHIRTEMAEIQERLRAFEDAHGMPSEEFYRRFQNGEMGDAADFFEWSALYDMFRSLNERLKEIGD